MAIVMPVIVGEFNNAQEKYRVEDRQEKGQVGFGLVDSNDEIWRTGQDELVLFGDSEFQCELTKYYPPSACLALGSECYQPRAHLLNPRNYTHEDVRLKGDVDFSIPDLLTPEQVTEDIDYTIYILQTAYVGYYVLRDETETAIQKLQVMKETVTAMTPRDLELKISKIFAAIPDNHLSVQFVQPRGEQEEHPAEQRSFAEKQLSSSWLVKKDHIIRVKGHDFKVPIIRIHEMIVEDDPKFAAAMKDAVEGSDAIIIDLWNNGGGDVPPMSLLSLLTNRPLDAKDIYRLQTPEALAIRANQFEYQKQRGEHYTQRSIDERDRLYNIFSSNQFPMWRHTEDERSVLPAVQEPYRKPIYVLINWGDGSATEETIALLRQMPNVTLIGQPTGGAFHYGGCGRAFLPNSGLTLWVGTMYVELHTNSYEDPTFIEQTGFQPDIVTRLSARGGNRDRAEKKALWEIRRFFKLSPIHNIEEAFAQVGQLESMELGRAYSALVNEEVLTGPKESFLRRRTPQEILESGLSSGCGDKASAFYYLMEEQGFEVLFIDAAEISEESFLNHFSGHTGVAVYDSYRERWILTDPTDQEIVDDNWDPNNRLYDGKYWIGYAGDLDHYPAQNQDQLKQFYQDSLSAIPAEVLGQFLPHSSASIDFTVDQSFYSAGEVPFNHGAEGFLDLGLALKKVAGQDASTIQVVICPGEKESGRSTCEYNQELSRWELRVGQISPMDEHLMSYVRKSLGVVEE